MGRTQVEYWIMVKPLHPKYNFPVPGKGKLGKGLYDVPDDNLETMYFRKTVKSCSSISGCGFALDPVPQPVWGLHEVCYNLEQLRRAYKRCIKQWDERSVKIIQRVGYETIVRN